MLAVAVNEETTICLPQEGVFPAQHGREVGIRYLLERSDSSFVEMVADFENDRFRIVDSELGRGVNL